LAIRKAVTSSLVEPVFCGRVVRPARSAPCVENGKIVHGADIAELRGAAVPGPRHASIFFYALSALMKSGEAILGRRVTLRCGTAIPFNRLFQVFGDTHAFRETRCNFDLGGRVASRSRDTQRLRPNACWRHGRLPAARTV